MGGPIFVGSIMPSSVPFHSQLSHPRIERQTTSPHPPAGRFALSVPADGRPGPQEPGAKSQEPRTKSQEPKTKSLHSAVPSHLRSTASQPSAQVSIGTAGAIARQRAVAGSPRAAVARAAQAPLLGSARLLDHHGQQLRDQPRHHCRAAQRSLDHRGRQLRDQRIRPFGRTRWLRIAALLRTIPLRKPSKNCHLPFARASAASAAPGAFQASQDQSAPNAR